MTKKKYLLKFVTLLFILGLITGFIINQTNETNYMPYINDFLTKANNYNNTLVFHNTFLIIITFVLALSIIGIIFIYCLYFFEAFSIGFTLSLFIKYYKIKGFIFYLLYFLIFKLLFILLFTYFLIMSTKFSHKFLDSLIKNNNIGLTRYIKNHFLRFIMVLLIVLVYSLLIGYFSIKITTFLLSITIS